MKNIGFERINITGGFWKDRVALNRDVTIPQVYRIFDETGRIKAFKCSSEISGEQRPHIFWDSDVAKWMESAAYAVHVQRDEGLEALVDAIVDDLAANQGEDGYYNSYFNVIDQDKRFKLRDWHELYCAGHLMEAAVAYYNATGKRKLLDCMEKFAAYIEKVFVTEDSADFMTPGHEEIELALIKMYDCTKNERWKRLCEFFIDKRGNNTKDNSIDHNQSHLPVREQTEAVGHSVRACYLYAAMADLARINGDEGLKKACDALFSNIVNKRMYITGGVGSSAHLEKFTIDYDLPNSSAYAETCAAIALAFFARRMQLMYPDSIYSDVIERICYNGFLSSTSLDGKCFFYENPIEIPPRASKLEGHRYPITERVEYFACSCCPPNITRFVASITDGMYTLDEESGDIYVRQFIASEAEFDTPDGVCRIEQITDYPRSGKITVKYSGKDRRLLIRVPSWYQGYEGKVEHGNAVFEVKDGDVIELDFEMKPVYVAPNIRINDSVGRYALTYGPFVMCLESPDNGANLRDIRVDTKSEHKVTLCDKCGAFSIEAEGTRSVDSPMLYAPVGERQRTAVRFIPYFAFGNRGDAEMLVFVNADL